MPNETEVKKNLQKNLDAMNAEDVQDLRKSLSAQDKENFDNYLNALNALNALTDKFYQTDYRHRNLDQDSYRDLMDKYKKSIEAGRKFLSGQVPQAMQDTVQVVQNLLSQDYGELSGLAVSDQVISLPMAIDRARGLNVDASKKDIKTVGGAVSSRMKVSVINERGQRTDGYFTSHKNLDSLEDLRAAFLSAADAMDKIRADLKSVRAKSEDVLSIDESYLKMAADTLREYTGTKKLERLMKPTKLDLSDTAASVQNYCSDYRKNHKRNPSFLEVCHKLGTTQDLWYFLGIDEITADALGEKLNNSKSRKKNAKELGLDVTPFEVVAKLSRTLDGIRIQDSVCSKKLNIKTGNNITRRNCAFTTLAGLAGVSHLVADAHPMTIYQDGKPLEGVFMENARGITTGEINTSHPVGRVGIEEYMLPSGKKATAAVQLLDYLGLNADRHSGNISYIFNEKGQLTGLQCFDNDSSFGERIPGDDQKIHVLTALDNIRVIPKDMAEHLRAMTPEMLQSAFQQDLTKEEIDALCKRLEKVKERLGNKIRIVEDSEWAGISMKELAQLDMQKEMLYDPLAEKSMSEDQLASKNIAAILAETGNGVFCSNLFETALIIPTKTRAAKRELLQKTRNEAPRSNISGEDASQYEYLRDQYIDLRAAEDEILTEIQQLTEVEEQFAPAQQMRSVAGIHPENNTALAAEWAKSLRKPVKEQKFQAANHGLVDELEKFLVDSRTLPNDEKSFKKYAKKLTGLMNKAKEYMSLRMEPKKPGRDPEKDKRDARKAAEDLLKQMPSMTPKQLKKIKDPVVRTLGEMTLHLKQQASLISAAIKADKERMVLQTMDLSANLARSIDRMEERVNKFCTYDAAAKKYVPKENVPEYVVEYGLKARESLADLIDLAQQDMTMMDPTEKETFYESVSQSVAGILMFEQAESNLEKHLDPDPMAEQSKTPEDRRMVTNFLANNNSLRKILGIESEKLRPEQLAAFCADPNATKELCVRMNKLAAAEKKRSDIVRRKTDVKNKMDEITVKEKAERERKKQEQRERNNRIKNRMNEIMNGNDDAPQDGTDTAQNGKKSETPVMMH